MESIVEVLTVLGEQLAGCEVADLGESEFCQTLEVEIVPGSSFVAFLQEHSREAILMRLLPALDAAGITEQPTDVETLLGNLCNLAKSNGWANWISEADTLHLLIDR